MKKVFALTCVLCFCLAANAQDDLQKALDEAAQAIENAGKAQKPIASREYWTSSAVVELGLNQTSLSNWAAGGYNTLSLSTGLDAKADYKKNLTSWSNRLQLNYAFLWSADKENLLQKSADRMYFESKWAYKTSDKSKWNYSAAFNFRSQFTDTKDKYILNEQTGKWDGTLKSGFFSPAYTDIALGMEWKPSAFFDMSISPLTGGFTICTEESLRPNYGMKAKGDIYSSALFQLGAQIKANARLSVNDVFNVESQLVLFTDYLSHPFSHNRVNWDNKVSWQVSKLLMVSASTWLIYDPIVMIKSEQHPDGIQMIQFKEFVSFSISYTFKPRNK